MNRRQLKHPPGKRIPDPRDEDREPPTWFVDYLMHQIRVKGGEVEMYGTVKWPRTPHPGTLTHSIVSDADKLAREINEEVMAGEKEIARALRDFAATTIRDYEATKAAS